MKHNWELDTAVLLIFFVRDDTFRQVFESVKKARPRTLLLWQDGPRKNKPDDVEGIEKCRKILDEIDWDCEIHTKFNTENYGCDPSTHFAHKWAFTIVDKCIVLEDDQCPSQSFFSYCKELLDKYENDERISHICGYNFLGEAEWCPYDYLFSYTGSGAWASWKRTADRWDSEYNYLDDEYAMKNIRYHYGKQSNYWLWNSKRHRATGIPHWESIFGMSEHLCSSYAIIPKYNLVENLGISQNATHSTVDNIEIIPKNDRNYYRKAQELNMPLNHPKYVLPDGEYTERLRKQAHPNIIKKIKNKTEYTINLIKFGRLDVLKNSIKKRFKK